MILFGIFATALAVGTWSFFSSEAQRNASVRFEYSVINGTYSPYPPDGPTIVTGGANICYLTPQGCQNEEVRAEVTISKFVQDEKLENSGRVRSLAQERAIQNAVARAIAKLGNDGWEIVDVPEVEFDLYYLNQNGVTAVREAQKTDRQHIWFKRMRQ